MFLALSLMFPFFSLPFIDYSVYRSSVHSSPIPPKPQAILPSWKDRRNTEELSRKDMGNRDTNTGNSSRLPSRMTTGTNIVSKFAYSTRIFVYGKVKYRMNNVEKGVLQG